MLAHDSPTTVVVVLLGAVYTLTSDVPTPMRLSQVSVLGIGVSDGHPRVGAQHPGPYLQQPGL